VQTWALVLTVCGAALNAGAAVWLLSTSNPHSDRYTDDGMLYPGQQRSQVVPELVRDQRKIAALTVVGSTLLVMASVLAFLADSSG
jgi:hypothetical protein